MRNKIILLIGIMLLLNLINVDAYAVIFRDSFNRGDSVSLGINWSNPTVWQITNNTAQSNFASSTAAYVNLTSIGTSGYSTNFTVSLKSLDARHKGIALMADDTAGTNTLIFFRHDSLGCGLGTSMGDTSYIPYAACNVVNKNINITINYKMQPNGTEQTQYWIYVEDSYWGNYNGSKKNENTSQIGIHVWGTITNAYIDEFRIVNNLIVNDTVAPIVSNIQCQSCTGGINVTSDITPTLNASTNENANCKLSRNNRTWITASTTGTTFHIATINESESGTLGTQVNLTFNCTDSFSNSGYGTIVLNYSETIEYLWDNISYSIRTIENAYNNFSFVASVHRLNISASIFYNKTYYSLNKKMIPYSINFTTTIRAAKTSSINVTIPFKIVYNITYENGTLEFVNTTIYNQTVYKMYIDSCGNITNTTALNYSIKNEETNELIYNLQLNQYYVLYLDDKLIHSREYSFNKSFSNTSTSICIYPTWATLRGDAILDYYASNYAQRSYYLTNVSLTNITSFVLLYLSNSSSLSNINIYIRDQNDRKMDGVYVQVERYYPETNSYKTIEIYLTNVDGQIVAHLIPYTVRYRFTIIQNGVNIYQTGTDFIYQSPVYIYINLQAAYLDTWKKIRGMSVSDLTYNNNTRTFSITYADTSGILRTVALYVARREVKKDVVICHANSTSVSDTLSCIIPNINGSYFAEAYADSTTEHSKYLIGSASAIITALKQLYGSMGVYLSFMIVGVLSGIGMVIAGAVGVILFGFLGVFISSLFGLLTVKITVLSLLGLISILIVYNIGKKWWQ